MMGNLTIVRRKKMKLVTVRIFESLDVIPDSAPEGTIGIISSIPLKTVYIQRNEPAIPHVGDAWVEVGVAGGAVKNVWRYIGIWTKEPIVIYYGDYYEVKAGSDFYNGSYASNDKGEISLLTSGTLTLDRDMIADVYIVGGGGAGRYGGGGGGYTKTVRKIQLVAGQEYEIVIGEGGIAATEDNKYGTAGGETSAFGYSAAGAGIAGHTTSTSGTARFNGGSGGSGGGGGATSGAGANGGKNGANGKSTSGGGAGRYGQGYTTRAFGEEFGALYAAGGGGCPGSSSATPGAGGEPGAGDGAYSTDADVSGAPNTGSGGGGTRSSAGRKSNGGSGIVIIRQAKAVGRQYLYSASDEHTGITEGWVGNNKKSNSSSGATAHAPTIDRTNADYIVADTQTGGYGGMFITSNKIELEHYKEIVFEGEITAVDGVAQNIYAGAWETIGDYYQQNPTKFVGSSMGETLTQIVVDVSDVDAPCYIGLGLTRTKAKITACYLIPKE